jgi:hypothetical protein
MCDSEFSAFLSSVTLGDRDVDYVGRGDPSGWAADDLGLSDFRDL